MDPTAELGIHDPLRPIPFRLYVELWVRIADALFPTGTLPPSELDRPEGVGDPRGSVTVKVNNGRRRSTLGSPPSPEESETAPDTTLRPSPLLGRESLAWKLECTLSHVKKALTALSQTEGDALGSVAEESEGVEEEPAEAAATSVEDLLAKYKNELLRLFKSLSSQVRPGNWGCLPSFYLFSRIHIMKLGSLSK